MNRNLEELQSELKSEKDSVCLQYISKCFILFSCNVLQCIIGHHLNNIFAVAWFFLGRYVLISLHLPALVNGFHANPSASDMIVILKLQFIVHILLLQLSVSPYQSLFTFLISLGMFSQFLIYCITFQGAALAKENEALKERLNDYKETLEKSDRKEKIRELNEKIVSLKIELSVSTFFIVLSCIIIIKSINKQVCIKLVYMRLPWYLCTLIRAGRTEEYEIWGAQPLI